MFVTYRKSLCGIMFSFLQSKPPGVECWEQMVDVVGLSFQKKKKTYQTVLQSAYAIFHSNQHYLRLSVPLYPC